MRQTKYRTDWWTKDRVIEGLHRFYQDFRIAPTSTEEYQKRQQFTGPNRNGVGNPYPSSYGVLKHFASFRQAWAAVGVETDRSYEPWTPEEEWFLTEGAGILSRKELARALNRTPNAVHRRIYDLGLHTYKARGWTFNRVMRVTGVPDYTLRRYADRGDLPYFRGSKCCYVGPADLLTVKEIDWENPPAELAEAARHSLMTRLVKILRRENWRAGSLYQVHRKTTTDKRHQRKLIPPGPRPVEVNKGDWVKVKRHPELANRTGYVHTVYWSSYGSLSDKRRKSGKPRTTSR